MGEALDAIATDVESAAGTPWPSHQVIKRVAEPIRALLAEPLEPTMDELWAAVTAALPSRTWVVGAQYIPARTPRDADQWWVWVEPGVSDVGDKKRRQAMRVNSRNVDRVEAFEDLAAALERLYPRPRLAALETP